MAQDDLLKRFLDAGMAFTAMTQQRAEAIAKDLVKAGEMQAEQAQAAAQELFDRSRKNTEKLVDQIRREVRDQIGNLGLATKADIARLDRKISSQSSTGAPRSSAKKTATKKTAAKKTATKKAAAKKTTAKKSSAKKSAAKKTSGRSRS
jgi:polyhydroxyalkanoate synthesis regulator phasin